MVEPLRQGPEIETLAFFSARGDQRDPSDQRLTCRDVRRQDQRSRFVPYRIGGAAAKEQSIVKPGRAGTAGGTWNPDPQVWELGYDRAIALGLEDRIVPDVGPERGPSI
jgi:hypothetical protein